MFLNKSYLINLHSFETAETQSDLHPHEASTGSADDSGLDISRMR